MTLQRITAAAVLIVGGWAQAQTPPAPPVSAAPVIKYEYDAQGNPTRTTLAPSVTGFGFATQASYDKLNRAKDTTDAKGAVIQFGYDGRDQLVQVTDPRLLLTAYLPTGLGDLIAQNGPDAGPSVISRDAAGNPVLTVDGRGMYTLRTFDVLNRLTAVYYGTDNAMRVYGYAYDEAFGQGKGHLTTMLFLDGVFVATPAPGNWVWSNPGVQQLTYDALGHVVSKVQATAAMTGANSADRTHTVGYYYDTVGRYVATVYPSGRMLYRTYTDGKITALSLVADANATGSTPIPLVNQIAYEPFGAVSSWQWQMAGSTQQLHQRLYDTSGRPVRYRLGKYLRDLTYDAGDRITAYTHYDAASGTATSAASALNQSFGYDEVGRVKSVVANTSSWAIGYDASGNRTGVTLNATASTYTTAATSNRLTATTNPTRSFVYDEIGNTTADGAFTATYGYDKRLKTLTKAGVTTTYTYNGLGQRVRKFSSSGAASTVIFVYDEDGQLLGEYDQAGVAIREYVWLGSTPVAVFMPDPANAANPPLIFYIHTDHLDSPRVVLNTAGAERWNWYAEPFGVSAPNTNPASLGAFAFSLRMPGQLFDQESGMHYNYFRDYDPSLGRFAQSDPIGLQGGINTYAYVGGNPLQYTDPNGLNPVGGAVLGAEIGTAIFPGVGTVVGAGVGLIGGYLIADRLSNLIFNRPKNPPDVGPPNGWIQGPRRGRQYGPDGAPQCDIDKPHQGNEVDHVHEWPGGVREEPGRPVSPWPRPGG